MRIVTALLIAALVGIPALATPAIGTTQATFSPGAFPDKLERVDRDGLTPQEWVRAMMMKNSPVDLTDATFTPLEVPAGHTIVGQVVDGAFTLSVVPDADLTSPATQASGLAPGRDCLNDVVDYWFGSGFYLTANILYPAAPNIASADMCNGTPGLYGPVNYLTFSVTGDAGGWLYLSNGYDGEYEIGCYPLWDDTASAMAGAGAGVGSQFQNTLHVANSTCYVAQIGPQPSAWESHYGVIVNWNYYWGEAHGSTMTTGLYVDNFP